MPNNPYRLRFIPKKKFKEHVEHVINISRKSLEESEKKFYKNSVDPFSALFDALWQDISLEEWKKQESSRQNQKTLQNALGNFHQNILGSINGWENLGVGKIFDIKNDSMKIIAEVKNKHNTTKGNHKVAIYDDLKSQLDGKYKGYTAYYIEIIPRQKKTYNKAFTPSDNRTKTRRPVNEFIRVIDGKSFYELAASEKDALQKVYMTLPYIIEEVLGKNSSKKVRGSDFMSLFTRIY